MLLALGILLAGLAGRVLPPRAVQGEGAGPARAMVLHDEGYVGSDACARCHASNHASWEASFHRTMTQAPSAAAVLAPFEGTAPESEGIVWRLEREQEPGQEEPGQEGEAFFATPLSPAGEALGPRARVALMTGSHHYQIYWLVSPLSPSLAQLPLVWHVGERAWVPRKAMFLIPPGPSASEADRWQEVCIKCHTTNGTPIHADSGATRVAELGIACEACHGPGRSHVDWRQRPEAQGAGADATDPVNPAELDPARASQICGQCHGIHAFADPADADAWRHAGFSYRPGEDLAATRSLLRGRMEENGEALRAFLARNPGTLEGLFWSDGEVRVSGREYNGLVESPCFARGSGERRLGCLACHELHVSSERIAAGWTSDQLRPGMDGPNACLGCHPGFGEPEKLAAHTHHAPDSSGSDCLNCHMPYTTYGLTKAIRSHTISSPSVAVSLATGRPNACNQCHLDRSLGWAAEALARDFGQPAPELDEDQATVAASVLWTLTGDAGQRVLMAWSLTWEPARAVSGTGWMPYLVSTLLLDDYDAVRWIATRAARLLPGREAFSLGACDDLEEQRNHARETILADWLRDGLRAEPAQRQAVLVGADGKLDEARFRRLYSRRDPRPVSLAE